MQITTAKIVAKELGDNPKVITPQWMESHPITMIRYGARHFSDLLKEFHGNYYYATRAYNAGCKRIWLAKHGSKRWKYLSVSYYNEINAKYQILAKKLKEE